MKLSSPFSSGILNLGWSWPESNGGREAEVAGGGEEKRRGREYQENHITELSLFSVGWEQQLFLKAIWLVLLNTHKNSLYF